MGQKIYNETSIQSIANAIREKTKTNTKYTVADMPSGINEVYEAGKSAKNDNFWEQYQENGTKTAYDYAFCGPIWDDETFSPKYDICPITAEYCLSHNKITNLKQLLEDKNIILDTSNVARLYGFFEGSTVTHLPVIDCRIATNTTHLCANCAQLISVTLIVSENTGYGSTFNGCPELVDLTIKGIIGKSSFYVGHSHKLNKESLISIITALSSTTSGLSVTLSATAVNNAFETAKDLADGSSSKEWLALVATKPNWTISLV